MESTEKARFLGMITNGHEFHFKFQNKCSAAGDELPDSARPEAPTDNDSFGVLPFFQF